ncbi:hypothetical protein NEOLEDRAFT_1070340 [Neolentinus lepideus HHB14362 ss-1]|uniref:RRM domain-containing protein n=1 Tax=Neolentinus lepideus HHB14362 ss-1 TaxID=1314782 RepID=A0A165QWT3_9AGAM|nr:hypothetical protein NEOLEDRAFT_1070340 [Neolentinus lepideus HHB14362 ss-1]
MPRILFVSGFHRSTRARDLAYEFERYGPLVRCDVPAPRNPHAHSTPYAFVEFQRSRDAEEAYIDMHGRHFEGYRLSVQWAKNPPSSVWRYDRRSPPPRSSRDRRDRSKSPRRNDRDREDRDKNRDRRDDRDWDREDRDKRRSRSPVDRSPADRKRSASPERRKDDKARTPPPADDGKNEDDRAQTPPSYEN